MKMVCSRELRFDTRAKPLFGVLLDVVYTLGIALIFLFPAFLFSGSREIPVVFSHLNIKQGLSQNAVNCILQDSTGFIWLGTEDGLNKYDGYNFTVYKTIMGNPGSLSYNYITSIVEDKDGILWVGTWKGLNAFNLKTENITRYFPIEGDDNSISERWITTLMMDSSGSLWVGTRRGLNRMDMRTGRFVRFFYMPGHPNSLSNNIISALAEGPRGTFWIGTNGGGLNCYIQESGRFIHYRSLADAPGSLSHDKITSIFFDSKGTMWVGTENGLNRFDASSQTFKKYFHRNQDPGSLSKNSITSIREDFKNNLWVGTIGGGLNIFNRETETFTSFRKEFNNPNSLSHDTVISLFEDRTHVMWVGTWNGISKMDGEAKPFFHYQSNPLNPDSLANNEVRAIWEDRDGIIWIGMEGGGLDKMDRRTGRVVHYKVDPGDPAQLSNNSVRCLFEDRLGEFWVGTYGGGLQRLNRKTNRFERFRYNPADPQSLSNDRVRCITGDHEGNLWVGTYGGGVNILDRQSGKFSHYRSSNTGRNTLSSVSSDYITAIHQDHNGYIWIGTDDNGLNKFDYKTRTFTQYRADPQGKQTNTLSSDTIFCIHEDRYGILWIGTHGGGLNVLDPQFEWFSFYDESHGLPNSLIYGILEGDNQDLWLSTNRGLSRFDTENRVFTNYSFEDGLQDNEFNASAYHKGLSGELYFGGINGFNAFFPGHVKDNHYIPIIVLTDFKILNRKVHVNDIFNGRVILEKSLAQTSSLQLSYRENIFSFEFASLHYASPSSNRYAYRMEGLETNWNYVTDRRYVVYTNIAPGNYLFRVKGTNNDDLWNEKGVSLSITVTPPFWKMLWFRAVLLATGLLVLLLVVKLRTYRVRVLNRQLEKRIRERTRELELANERAEKERETAQEANKSKSMFLARMSHEIRTPMNGVIGFTDMLLDTHLNEEQFEYVRTIHRCGQSLLSLINDILDFSKIEAGRLSFEPVDFDPEMMMFDICDLMMPRLEGKAVKLCCHVGEEVPAYVRGDAGRYRQVLVNLVGNAVKFTEMGMIDMTINVDNQTNELINLHAIVRDTGIGIPEDKIEGVFEVFQQADETVTRKFGGTGLGLAISKQIANLMKGNVWVESTVGQGSTFHFTTWLEKSSKEIIEHKHIPILSGKRILVVDDNDNNRRLLTRTLEESGIEVKEVSCGKDVVPALRQAVSNGKPFHLCILDIQMPGMSGYDVSREIRHSGEAFANISLLAFSSITTARSSRYKEAGFNGFLPKPLQRKRMMDMVKKMLDMKDEKENEIVTQYTVREEAKHAIHILLVEDNPVNQKLAQFLFSRAGYQVDIVGNGKEALDAYIANPDHFDLIFMDIQMPVMDGIEATKHIRQAGGDKIPIIAMTAEAIIGDREKCIAAGMNDYISKPIKRETVFEMVKKWALDKS